MIIQCDKYFAGELKKRGFDIDYKQLISAYKESRNHPDLIKKLTRKLLNKGYHEWNEETLTWVEITKEEYNQKVKEKENKEIENVMYE